MKRVTLPALVAASMALAGCVTTTGQGARPDERPKTLAEAMPQFRVPDVFSGMRPVALDMDVGGKTFNDGGRFAESFVLLPAGTRGSKEYRESIDVMTKIGSTMGRNRQLEAYIYIAPGMFRDPAIRDYIAAIEQGAGPNRAMAKADLRMARLNTPLVWVRDPLLAANGDALIAAEKRGLVAKSQ